MGDRRTEAIALVNFGHILGRLGDRRGARVALESCLALCREIGARLPEGYALQLLGELAQEEGEEDAAERLLAEALRLRRGIGHRDGEADTLGAKGARFARLSRTDEARADLDAALALARELSLPGVELLATARLATLPRGDAAVALAALAAHEGRMDIQDAMQARFLLWQATRDPAHLAEAKRRLDFMVAHAPPENRESMVTNVRLHREIAQAAREQGIA
jgi:tetratricopeptide (TPR) repeat protein